MSLQGRDVESCQISNITENRWEHCQWKLIVTFSPNFWFSSALFDMYICKAIVVNWCIKNTLKVVKPMKVLWRKKMVLWTVIWFYCVWHWDCPFFFQSFVYCIIYLSSYHPQHPYQKAVIKFWVTLSLSLHTHSKLVTLLLAVSTTGKFTHNIKGSSRILWHNMYYG